ncbi:MAG: DUF5808 domain-containing protein [Myxococcota bacterium]
MEPGPQLMMFVSVLSAALTIHFIATPRPGRFMLVRVPDADRHRARARRALVFNGMVAVAALLTVFFASDPTWRAHAVALVAAIVVPSTWMVLELRRVLRQSPQTSGSSRYRVSLESPPPIASYLSPTLVVLDLAAVAVPAVLLQVYNGGEFGPWFFFLPVMLFISAVVGFCIWLQVSQRRALPASDPERYARLDERRRRGVVRMLESALVCWNLAGGLFWLSIAMGHAGPGYAGAVVGVLIGGAGVLVVIVRQLPRLARISDELATLADADALGTRANGWRWGGLVYYAPNDPALAVPKRSGIGQTLNLARPLAWAFLGGLVLAPTMITVMALTRAQG